MAEFTKDETKRLQETIAGILAGKKMKEHRVVKHRWNFEPPKPLEITRQGGTITAKGRFTHYLRFVGDDVVTYAFTIDRGQVKDVEVNYEDRGVERGGQCGHEDRGKILWNRYHIAGRVEH